MSQKTWFFNYNLIHGFVTASIYSKKFPASVPVFSRPDITDKVPKKPYFECKCIVVITYHCKMYKPNFTVLKFYRSLFFRMTELLLKVRGTFILCMCMPSIFYDKVTLSCILFEIRY